MVDQRESQHDRLRPPDLVQRGGERTQNLADGVLNIHTPLAWTDVSLRGCRADVCTVSGPTSELRDKRMPALGRCLLSGV